MPVYRLRIVGLDPVTRALECADDRNALLEAERLAARREAELWERDRCVARFAGSHREGTEALR
jgi:hypothetical protein